MKMQLIQPFITAADCVLAQSLNGPATIGELSMEQDEYRRKGCAAHVAIRGEIEGSVVLDMAPDTAMRIASTLAAQELKESDQLVRETVYELANMVIGNAVTLLNDHGYQFKVFPPEEHLSDGSPRPRTETEELAIYFDTSCGRVFLNVRVSYNTSAASKHAPALAR